MRNKLILRYLLIVFNKKIRILKIRTCWKLCG